MSAKSLRRRLPPLTALTAFEAAARLASFTRAARELGVTQAAVSRQIHQLEEEFGFPLFLRLHRRIELTAKGRQLAASATSAFQQVAATIDDITRPETGDELAISASVAFSHFWLLPRISEFSRLHPGIRLRIVTQDATPDLEQADIDLAIRFGSGMWSDGHAELLFDDEIFPVCSADYAAHNPAVRTVGDLLAHPLIANDTEDPTWTGWTEWLSAFSVKATEKDWGFRCSFYTEAIYAALNGQGIALGWKRLVSDLLAQQRVVRLTEAKITTRNAYFIVVPRRRTGRAAAETFIEWLRTKA